jgi:hypothetical protein
VDESGKNAAMSAPGQAGSQAGLGAQNRSQQQIILQQQGGCSGFRRRISIALWTVVASTNPDI